MEVRKSQKGFFMSAGTSSYYNVFDVKQLFFNLINLLPKVVTHTHSAPPTHEQVMMTHDVCVCVWGSLKVMWVGEQLHCRSIKGSVVITAEAVSVTSRLHYLVSFVPAFAACLIE